MATPRWEGGGCSEHGVPSPPRKVQVAEVRPVVLEISQAAAMLCLTALCSRNEAGQRGLTLILQPVQSHAKTTRPEALCAHFSKTSVGNGRASSRLSTENRPEAS